MATAKKTTTKKTVKKTEEEPVIQTPDEIVQTPDETIKTPDLPDYSNLSPFGRFMAGGGIK